MKGSKSELLYTHLKKRIYAGEFAQLERLPSEQVLSDFYGCSRPTLRKALARLEEEALLTRKQGKGSFLTPRAHSLSLHHGKERLSSPSLFGIIFPSLGANYVLDSISSEITRELALHNSSLVWGGTLHPHAPDLLHDVQHICEKYRELQVDGVFFSPIENTPLQHEANTYITETCKQAGIPLVLIDSGLSEYPCQSEYDLVSIDHLQASYMLTQHIIDQGARNIHFLQPSLASRSVKIRKIGFREALFAAELPYKRENIHTGDPSDSDFVQSVVASHPDAIVCSNDGTAINLLNTLRKLGVNVPKDVAVAGFDNVSYLSYIRIPLTSIIHPSKMISKEAVSLMLTRITYPNLPVKTVLFGGTLVSRISTQLGKEIE